jgi:hypothetical protein
MAASAIGGKLVRLTFTEFPGNRHEHTLTIEAEPKKSSKHGSVHSDPLLLLVWPS